MSQKPHFFDHMVGFSLGRRVTMFVILLTVVAIGAISAVRLPLENESQGHGGTLHFCQCPLECGGSSRNHGKNRNPPGRGIEHGKGFERIETHGYKWGSRIELHFKYGMDMDVAYREVRDRAERARFQFPEGADRTYIYKYQPGAEPVVSFRISYDPDSDYYTLVERHVIAPLQRIMGVADVDFRIYRRELKIEVDKEKADAHGVNMRELGRLLRADNITVASGSVMDGGKKYTLKSTSTFESIQEIQQLPLSETVMLKDIASIVYEPEEAERLYRYNGQPANGISVRREGEANTVEVSQAVVEAIETIRAHPNSKALTSVSTRIRVKKSWNGSHT